MMGPKIIENAPTYERAEAKRAETGIRQTAKGWAAVRDGRLIDAYEGTGSRRAAILAAGTNKVIV